MFKKLFAALVVTCCMFSFGTVGAEAIQVKTTNLCISDKSLAILDAVVNLGTMVLNRDVMANPRFIKTFCSENPDLRKTYRSINRWKKANQSAILMESSLHQLENHTIMLVLYYSVPAIHKNRQELSSTQSNVSRPQGFDGQRAPPETSRNDWTCGPNSNSPCDSGYWGR